jgi:pantoate--beta-alanine ligase
MRRLSSPAGMQRLARSWQASGVRVGFVPTMGYLHAGHLSLVREARRRVGPQGMVVLSIYVNPTQFGPSEDLSRYPRDLPRDLRRCREAGVDVVFTPHDATMYPGRDEGRYSTYVVEERLGCGLEGGSRPTHFRGVTTVVAKLFNLVLPEVAVFGAKDWQQAAVVRRMAEDLRFPVRIVVAPTVRETDGLAMSSRNQYLNPAQREQATVLYQAIGRARARVRKGPVAVDALRRELTALIESRPEARVDYVAFIEPSTLEPVERVGRGTHLALAVRVGPTRLIDNGRL